MKYIPRKRFRKWWTRSGTYEYRWRVNWLDFRHCSYIYHSPRVFHPLAMLSTSQKDTPFSCLAMVGLNSLLVRAVARTYNSPSWTRHAFLRLISNSLSRRCLYVPYNYTSSLLSNYHHRYRTLHRERNGEKTWFPFDSRQLVLYVERFSLVEFLRRI